MCVSVCLCEYPPLLCLRASLVAQTVKNLPTMQETQFQSQGQENPLEEGMATCSNVLAWRIPWTEEPGGLQSMGLQRVNFARLKRLSMHALSAALGFYIRLSRSHAGSDQVPGMRKGPGGDCGKLVSTHNPLPHRVMDSHWRHQFHISKFKDAFSILAAQQNQL